MSRITEERWSLAQKNEQKFWEEDWAGDLEDNQHISEKYWKFHINILNKNKKILEASRILEIGGGATPMIGHILKGERYALDPLMKVFLKKFNLPNNIKYLKGKGENLPFKKNFFDVIIITNVIDHVHNYQTVLKEIRKVLKPSGVVYLSVDCNMYLLKKYRDLRETLGYGDPCHPYTFTLKSAMKALKYCGFSITKYYEGIGDQGKYAEKRKRKEPTLKKIKNALANGGIPRLVDSLIYRALNNFGKYFSPEKNGRDFIFILKK